MPICACLLFFGNYGFDFCSARHHVTEIDYCDDNPCDPFGDCNSLIGTYNCTCKPGYRPVVNNTQFCDSKSTPAHYIVFQNSVWLLACHVNDVMRAYKVRDQLKRFITHVVNCEMDSL